LFWDHWSNLFHSGQHRLTILQPRLGSCYTHWNLSIFCAKEVVLQILNFLHTKSSDTFSCQNMKKICARENGGRGWISSTFLCPAVMFTNVLSQLLFHQNILWLTFFSKYFFGVPIWLHVFFSAMNQTWVQELILAWFWPHFHLVYWMRRDLNPQPFNCESSLLTTIPDSCLFMLNFIHYFQLKVCPTVKDFFNRLL